MKVCLLALFMYVYDLLWQHDHKLPHLRALANGNNIIFNFCLFFFFLISTFPRENSESGRSLTSDVNIFTMANFKLPTWGYWILTWGQLSTAGCPELVVQAHSSTLLKPSSFQIPSREMWAGMISTFQSFFFQSNLHLVFYHSSFSGR